MKTEINDKFLTYKEVASRLGMSVRAVYRLVASNVLAKQVQVGSRSVRFPESEIMAFITDLKSNRGR